MLFNIKKIIFIKLILSKRIRIFYPYSYTTMRNLTFIMFTLISLFTSKFLQWGSIQITATYCQKSGLIGFIESFLTSQSSFCIGLDQIYVVSGCVYASVLTLMITMTLPIASSIVYQIRQEMRKRNLVESSMRSIQ